MSGANMSGVYVQSDGYSFLSFDGSESRESVDDSKKGHQSLVEWLNQTLPYLNLPWEASEDELRACLRDGTVLCSILNQLSPGSMRMGGSFEPACVKIERFLTTMDEMALPRFEVSDIEQGDMVPVLQSLKALKSNSLRNAPTRSLFDMLEKLLDESVKKMNGHVSHVRQRLSY